MPINDLEFSRLAPRPEDVSVNRKGKLILFALKLLQDTPEMPDALGAWRNFLAIARIRSLTAMGLYS